MKLALLGSTGSIGIQTLHVVRELARGGDFPVSVAVLAARSSVKLLEEQAREFRPQAVAVFDPRPPPRISAPAPGTWTSPY